MTELITPYEEIVLEQGLAKGLAKGLARGFAKGQAEGLAKGRVAGLTEGLLRALEARFGTVPADVRQQVTDVRDEARLCEGMRLVITEPTIERFLANF